MTETVLSHPVAERLTSLRLPRHEAAFLEQIARRGLDRSVVLALGDCAWIHNGAPILITGPTGTGKSWISCALAHKACLEGFQALYLRVPRLLNDLRVAHGEGTIARFYRDLARIDLLVLDDWGLAPIEPARGRDLLEILAGVRPPSAECGLMVNADRGTGTPRCARRCRRSAPGRRNNRTGRATAWRARDAPTREGSRVARTPCSTVLAQKPSAVVPMTEKSRRGKPPTTA